MSARLILNTATAAAIGIGLAVATPVNAGDEQNKTMTIGDKAPPIDIEHWVKGVDVKSRKFTPMTDFEEGKVYVLEFWATWCGPCKAGMPHLSELQEKYADYGVSIIGVSDEPLPTVISFLFDTWKGDGKVQNDRTRYTLATDPDETVKKDYFRAAGRTGIPSAFIIGKDGYVEWIGHPARMDVPLEEVVHGSWDRGAFKVRWEREQTIQRGLEKARKTRDWESAVKMLANGLEHDPNNIAWLNQQFRLLLTKVDRPEEAYVVGEKLAEMGWNEPVVLNGIAWLVVDDKNVSKRDLGFALKVAERANELTDSKDAAIIDTLARVYYEMGDLDKAIKWQKRAVEFAPGGPMGAGIKAALKQYEEEAGK